MNIETDPIKREVDMVDAFIDFDAGYLIEAAYKALSPGDRERFLAEVREGEPRAMLVGRFLRAARQGRQGADDRGEE